LAEHYGFPASGGSACGGTDPASRRYAAASEELDFTINYDPAMRGVGIKYRMGLGGEEETENKKIRCITRGRSACWGRITQQAKMTQ